MTYRNKNRQTTIRNSKFISNRKSHSFTTINTNITLPLHCSCVGVITLKSSAYCIMIADVTGRINVRTRPMFEAEILNYNDLILDPRLGEVLLWNQIKMIISKHFLTIIIQLPLSYFFYFVACLPLPYLFIFRHVTSNSFCSHIFFHTIHLAFSWTSSFPISISVNINTFLATFLMECYNQQNLENQPTQQFVDNSKWIP